MDRLKETDGLSEVDGPLTKKQLQIYLDACRPVVMRGLNREWTALQTWTPEYFLDMVRRHRDVLSPRRETPVGLQRIRFKDIAKPAKPFSEIVADCVDPVDKRKEIYIPGLKVKLIPYIENDAPKSQLLKDIAPSDGELFMGRNTQCVGHFHPRLQAILCQAQGRKHVRLYPPSEFKKLSPFGFLSKYSNRSRISFYQKSGGGFPNLEGVDYQLYPRAAGARYIDLILNPGDALFIPIHWLHVTQGEGWNVSIAYFWPAGPGEWKWNYPALLSIVSIFLKPFRLPFSISGKLFRPGR